MAVRKRRIDPDFRRAALADLALLDLTTDQQTDPYAWTVTVIRWKIPIFLLRSWIQN
jgi:hypothetical protein